MRVETEEICYEKLGSCSSWTCFRGWGKVWETVEVEYTFLGDFCWEVQMRKMGFIMMGVIVIVSCIQKKN